MAEEEEIFTERVNMCVCVGFILFSFRKPKIY